MSPTNSSPASATSTPPPLYAGIDLAKATLQLAYHPHQLALPNTAKTHQKLIALFAQTGPTQVILEATGGYEGALVQALHQAQVPVSVIQPQRVRAHAIAHGILAKTDKLDAQVLRHFGQAVQPAPTRPKTAKEKALADLVQRRRDLVEMRTMESNRTEQTREKAAARLLAEHLCFLDKQIAQCEKAIAKLIAADKRWQTQAERLQEIKGIGPITAAVLLADLPELGTYSDRAVAALAGVAPYAVDSGPYKGQRHIQGGRRSVRCALYLSAMTARLHDPILKKVYENLVGRGKAKMVALVAVMRRILVLANRLLKDPAFTLRHGSKKSVRPCSPQTLGSGAGEAPVARAA